MKKYSVIRMIADTGGHDVIQRKKEIEPAKSQHNDKK
jgi:hypothetical protein